MEAWRRTGHEDGGLSLHVSDAEVVQVLSEQGTVGGCVLPGASHEQSGEQKVACLSPSDPGLWPPQHTAVLSLCKKMHLGFAKP